MKWNPHWSYRILKISPQEYKAVEAYYDEDGNVDNITDISALRFVGDDVEELISVFELALNELKKNKDNVLEESNDKCNRDADEDCGC
ncbi:MAG: hypothetical protein QGH83_13835 [Candidatus Pacebacteria bacterium]|jgi:hypothetical protein|nr:hypothetical protein [Candidatus Paceibacterota bacterium]